MSNEKTETTTRKATGILSIGSRRSSYYVHIDNIAFQEGFNRRSRREKKETLKQQIISEGRVLTAISGYYLNGVFYVNHGHGRVECTRELIAEGHAIDPNIPAEVEPAPKTEEDRARLLARQIIDNSSENFSPIDTAKIVKELIDNFGWSNAKVGTHLGFTGAYVGQLLAVLSLPEDSQEFVEDGSISPTLASEIVREHKNDAPEVIQQAVEVAKKRNKKRATQKDVDSVTGQTSTGLTGGADTQDPDRKPKVTLKSTMKDFMESSKVIKRTEEEITMTIPKEIYQKLMDLMD